MKVKSKDIKALRESLLLQQGNCCALCGQHLNLEDAVLDHCHRSGAIRATLHRGCNSLLGYVEGGARRGVRDIQAFADGVGAYIREHKTDQTGLLHPTHRTPDEKKILAKKRRKRRSQQDRLK